MPEENGLYRESSPLESKLPEVRSFQYINYRIPTT